MSSSSSYIPNPISPRIQGNARSALADKAQSITGVIMGLFLLCHLHFESSILLGKDAFYHTVHFLEGSLFSDTGKGFPIVTQIITFVILVVFIVHAITALRRFPTQLGQWRALRNTVQGLAHTDTKIWFFQLLTGAALFFLVPVHLFEMLQNPQIGPHLSGERVYHDNVWFLYVLLLPAVVVHAVFGLYRVALKWGLNFERQKLMKAAKILVVYLMILGILSLIAYLRIGADLTLPVVPYSPH